MNSSTPTIFHAAVGLPAESVSQIPRESRQLIYTRHARSALVSDRLGIVTNAPRVYQFVESHLFEVGLNSDDSLHKFCVRIPGIKPDIDLILVLVPEGDYFVVKTLWLNESSDNHSTLNTHRYEKRTTQTS